MAVDTLDTATLTDAIAAPVRIETGLVPWFQRRVIPTLKANTISQCRQAYTDGEAYCIRGIIRRLAIEDGLLDEFYGGQAWAFECGDAFPLTRFQQWELERLNDHGETFPELADVIECMLAENGHA